MTWQSGRKSAIRFGALILGLLLLDACLYRDPGVEVTGGYEIVAISGGSRCNLWYSDFRDPRSYSDWVAHASANVSESDVSHSLSKGDLFSLDEFLEYDSVEDWRIARRERNAQPRFRGSLAEGVRGFKNDDAFIIGEYETGFFILDVLDNWIDTFTERASWEAAVAKRTPLSPQSLSSPRAWHLQTRDPVAFAIYGGVFLVALPWVFGPLRGDRCPKPPATEVHCQN